MSIWKSIQLLERLSDARISINAKWIDQAVGIGVAAHEGQLFGVPNQLLGVFTAVGLITLSASSVVLWWRRRPPNVLGAPPAPVPRERVSPIFVALFVGMGIYLPLLGLSMVAVRLTELFLLRRIGPAKDWLGLAS
ncbi:MAG: PepSY domain-containing protein [Bryobacterales bacterium]|nr:PepSY domain-containing protein [Bryobacterales bacterium]MBV9400928.1 PepSY domain-containing protein [Bryobacterales bacterium]